MISLHTLLIILIIQSLLNLLKKPSFSIDRNQIISVQKQDESLQPFTTLAIDMFDMSSRNNFIIDNDIFECLLRYHTDKDESHNYVLPCMHNY